MGKYTSHRPTQIYEALGTRTTELICIWCHDLTLKNEILVYLVLITALKSECQVIATDMASLKYLANSLSLFYGHGSDIEVLGLVSNSNDPMTDIVEAWQNW